MSKEKCNCLNETLDKISSLVQEKIPKNAEEYSIDWRGRVLRFDGGVGVGLSVEFEYRNMKKDGTPYAKMKKESRFVAMDFCPFCGEKY